MQSVAISPVQRILIAAMSALVVNGAGNRCPIFPDMPAAPQSAGLQGLNAG